MADKLPPFPGKPLIEIPVFIPTANFLEGDFGKAVLEEYQGRSKADYGSAPALNVLEYVQTDGPTGISVVGGVRFEQGYVKGSNPFAVVLVNQIISSEGLRTATQADLERVLKVNALPLRGQYEDTGLVLRTDGDPNEYLAKDLMAQIKARNPKAKMPAMVPLFSPNTLQLAVGIKL